MFSLWEGKALIGVMSNIQEKETEEKEISDEELIAAVSIGDRHAYQKLVKKYLPKTWRLARSILHNDQEAEDAVQEVFLSLWKTSKDWDKNGKARFSTWIYRVTFNKCIDIKRSKKETVPDENLPERASETAGAHENLFNAQISAKIINCMDELPETQKNAMLFYYYEELTVEEISIKMDTTEQAVRSLLKRGKKSLKEKLQFDPAFQQEQLPNDGNIWR